MSERYGTCGFASQIHEVTHESANPQPHHRPQVERWPLLFTCQLLSYVPTDLPPPIARQNGGFLIEAGDCESCAHYVPADDGLLLRLWRKRRNALRARQRRRDRREAARVCG